MKPDDLRDLLDMTYPGPWSAHEGFQIRSRYGMWIAEVDHNANRKLIAMAPDLANEVLRLHNIIKALVCCIEEPCSYIKGHQCAEVKRVPLCPICMAQEEVK
jgi:hypothetical protein